MVTAKIGIDRFNLSLNIRRNDERVPLSQKLSLSSLQLHYRMFVYFLKVKSNLVN